MFSPQFQQIISKHGLNLNHAWNKAKVAGHKGRHTHAYHRFMLKNLQTINKTAGGNTKKFLKHFNRLKKRIMRNPRLMYL